ncbi:MAG: hypothetical protein ABI761_13020 [Saprospiraceae bacterium]
MYTTKITVFNNRRPLNGVRITLEFRGLTQMGFTTPVYTDGEGIAYIQHASSGEAYVYLDHEPQRDPIKTPGRETYNL